MRWRTQRTQGRDSIYRRQLGRDAPPPTRSSGVGGPFFQSTLIAISSKSQRDPFSEGKTQRVAIGSFGSGLLAPTGPLRGCLLFKIFDHLKFVANAGIATKSANKTFQPLFLRDFFPRLFVQFNRLKTE